MFEEVIGDFLKLDVQIVFPIQKRYASIENLGKNFDCLAEIFNRTLLSKTEGLETSEKAINIKGSI